MSFIEIVAMFEAFPCDVYHSYVVKCEDIFCVLFYRINRRIIAISGPELDRKQSRGTNINPFTPVEVRNRAHMHSSWNGNNHSDTSTPTGTSVKPKPHKVGFTLSSQSSCWAHILASY